MKIDKQLIKKMGYDLIFDQKIAKSSKSVGKKYFTIYIFFEDNTLLIHIWIPEKLQIIKKSME